MIRRLTSLVPLCAIITLALVGARPANASIVQAFTRLQINPNATVDWGQLGGNGAAVPNPIPVVSVPATVGMTVSGSGGGNMQRLDEGAGWNGIFTGGDRLLFSAGATQPIILDFASPINGVAFQIQENFFGNYLATLDVYAADDTTLLASFNVNGNNTGGSTGLAPVIGAYDNTGAALIGSVRWRTNQVGNGTAGVSVNQVSLNTTGVPEPGVLSLLGGAGVAISAFFLRRRKR